VAFLATCELSTGPPRNETTKRYGIRENPQQEHPWQDCVQPKCIFVHMRCEARFFPARGNRNSIETDPKTNAVRKTRLQLLLCKTSIDIFKKAHLTLFRKCTHELLCSRFTPQFAIFAEPLRYRNANGKRRNFLVRECNVEAEVAELVFRYSRQLEVKTHTAYEAHCGGLRPSKNPKSRNYLRPARERHNEK